MPVKNFFKSIKDRITGQDRVDKLIEHYSFIADPLINAARTQYDAIQQEMDNLRQNKDQHGNLSQENLSKIDKLAVLQDKLDFKALETANKNLIGALGLMAKIKNQLLTPTPAKLKNNIKLLKFSIKNKINSIALNADVVKPMEQIQQRQAAIDLELKALGNEKKLNSVMYGKDDIKLSNENDLVNKKSEALLAEKVELTEKYNTLEAKIGINSEHADNFYLKSEGNIKDAQVQFDKAVGKMKSALAEVKVGFEAINKPTEPENKPDSPRMRN